MRRGAVVTALGIAQILGFGTSFYFPAVMAGPIMTETGWPLAGIVGGVTVGLLVAGLIAPPVSALVDRYGGRPVLAASSILFALGLVTIAFATSVPAYLAAWVVMGLAMGAGLYDAAFAALGRLYGAQARAPMTSLTLFGGFSGTICWPLSAYLAATLGWREACLVYAVLHLVVALPLLLLFPKGRATDGRSAAPDVQVPTAAPNPSRMTFATIAAILTLAAGIGSIVIVHLLVFLQALGVPAASAVALGMLFGPAQVGARLVERVFGDRYHPIWTAIGATILMAIGLLLFGTGTILIAAAIIIYAAGYGISWVVRGTLPLAVFGPERYPRLSGRLAFPSLIAQALAPAAGALLFERAGVTITIASLAVLACCNVALVVLLWRVTATNRPGSAGA